MPSTSDAEGPRALGLRDRPLGKLAILVLVLAAALGVSRSCGSSGLDVSKEEALAMALRQVDFKPECYQARVFRQGVKARSFWAVSLWTLDEKGEFGKVALVVLDAETGRVERVDHKPRLAFTAAQCAARV